MKIWKEFNSSHSSNITIISKFETADDANQRFEMIEDFILASWEQRYASIEEFTDVWKDKFHVDLPYVLFHERESIETGVDNDPHIHVDGDKIIIKDLRAADNIGSIIKLLRFSGARTVEIS